MKEPRRNTPCKTRWRGSCAALTIGRYRDPFIALGIYVKCIQELWHFYSIVITSAPQHPLFHHCGWSRWTTSTGRRVLPEPQRYAARFRHRGINGVVVHGVFARILKGNSKTDAPLRRNRCGHSQQWVSLCDTRTAKQLDIFICGIYRSNFQFPRTTDEIFTNRYLIANGRSTAADNSA